MIKLMGKGFLFFKSIATEDNLRIMDHFLTTAERVSNEIFDKMDELNDTVVKNTDDLCEVLDVEFLDRNSLKEIFDNYGAKNFHSVALLKGKYDDRKERRVYFVQKLDNDKKPINASEVLCIYANNVDTIIQQWFGDKEMILINK